MRLNEVMRLMHIVTLFATEVVLLRKLGKNEVALSKEPHSQPNFCNKTTSVANGLFSTSDLITSFEEVFRSPLRVVE
jgi:hypothetical protein